MSRRHAPSFSAGNKVARIVWGIVWTLLGRFSPPPLWGWRRFLLRSFGARIGARARVYPSARVWLPANLMLGDGAMLGRGVNCYNQGPIDIGANAVVSWNAVLCSSTHRVEDPAFPLELRPIAIGAECWIAAEAFVGPGVTMGDGAVLGARGVAMRDLEPWTYYGGNPAAAIKPRSSTAGSPRV